MAGPFSFKVDFMQETATPSCEYKARTIKIFRQTSVRAPLLYVALIVIGYEISSVSSSKIRHTIEILDLPVTVCVRRCPVPTTHSVIDHA